MSEYIYPNKTPISILSCEEAFNELTEKEKLYAHYLSKASWYGGLIVLFQTSFESPLIYTLLHKLFRIQSVSDLKQVALTDCGFSEDDFKAFMIYAAGIFKNMGNYKDMGDTKFIPNLPEEKFKKLILSSQLYKDQPSNIDRLLSKCADYIYSLKDNLCCLGFPPDGITTYLSKNVTAEDDTIVKNFLKEKHVEAWNSRLFKAKDEAGNISYEVRLASVLPTDDSYDSDFLHSHTENGHKFFISRGDYSQILEIVNKYLSKAKEYAANETEEKMIEKYVQYFKSGSIDAHKDGSRFWVQDKGPVIESYIGFIETYRDPAGTRAEFEGIVAMVNKKMSEKYTELVNSAENFLPLLPWPNEYEKDKFMRPDYTSLDVLTYAGSTIYSGICIPNYDDVKEKDGFKNVSLGNVMSVRPTEPPNYLGKEDQDLMLKYMNLAFEVTIGLHELLGHGSGKLFKKDQDGSFNFDVNNTVNFETNEKVTSWYDFGQTYDSIFGNIGSSCEECKAECVALYLCDNPQILRIFGYEGKEAEDIVYIIWLAMIQSGLEALQMYNAKTDAWLQAHANARYMILQVSLEAGEDFVTVKPTTGSDGNPDLLLTMDRAKIASVGKPALGKFLGKLQLYKSTADVSTARTMYEHYSAVKSGVQNPFLDYKDIVMARKKPRKMFVQSSTFIQDGKVAIQSYESNVEGLIQSWVDRMQDIDVDDILEELWEKDKHHFS